MVFGLVELGVIRWLEKPPDPSSVHAQEPKTRVVPSGTLLASLDPAIEFADELGESPTWRYSYSNHERNNTDSLHSEPSREQTVNR